MKNILVFLITVILTALVLVLPDLYFERCDKISEGFVTEDELNIKVAEDISVNKMIEIAVDENSRFVEYAYAAGMNAAETELMEIGMDVLYVLEEILPMEITHKEELIKNGQFNKVKVVGNSEYNSYVFSLCGMLMEMENVQIQVLYLPDTDEILSAYVFNYNEYAGLFLAAAEQIEELLGKYYGHDNWTVNIFESEMYFNQGSDGEDIWKIMKKMGLFEMEYSE